MIPPSAAVITTYLHWPTAQVDRSRGVSMFVNAKASGPLISTCRSTPTSQIVTAFSRCQYSVTGSS
jgi:hypothetical protein